MGVCPGRGGGDSITHPTDGVWGELNKQTNKTRPVTTLASNVPVTGFFLGTRFPVPGGESGGRRRWGGGIDVLGRPERMVEMGQRSQVEPLSRFGRSVGSRRGRLIEKGMGGPWVYVTPEGFRWTTYFAEVRAQEDGGRSGGLRGHRVRGSDGHDGGWCNFS